MTVWRKFWWQLVQQDLLRFCVSCDEILWRVHFTHVLSKSTRRHMGEKHRPVTRKVVRANSEPSWNVSCVTCCILWRTRADSIWSTTTRVFLLVGPDVHLLQTQIYCYKFNHTTRTKHITQNQISFPFIPLNIHNNADDSTKVLEI
jgi:hypothetical protein